MNITNQLLDKIVSQYAAQKWTGVVIQKKWDELKLKLNELDYAKTHKLLELMFKKQQHLFQQKQMNPDFDENSIFTQALELLSEKVYNYFWIFVTTLNRQNFTDKEKMEFIKARIESLDIFALSIVSYVQKDTQYPFQDYILECLEFNSKACKMLLDYYKTNNNVN